MILQWRQPFGVQGLAAADVMTCTWRRIAGDLLRNGAAMFDYAIRHG